MSSDPPSKATYKNKEWMYKQYIRNEKTTTEIADEAGVTQPTISRWLDRHDIQSRSQSDLQTDGDTEPLRDKQWLREQYINRERSGGDIADELDVTAETVTGWANKHGIELRNSGESSSKDNTDKIEIEDRFTNSS